MAKKHTPPSQLDHGGALGRSTERGTPLAPNQRAEQAAATRLNAQDPSTSLDTGSIPEPGPNRSDQVRAAIEADREAEIAKNANTERAIRTGNETLNQRQLDRRNEIADKLEAQWNMAEQTEPVDETEAAAEAADQESEAARAALEAAAETETPVEAESEPEEEAPKKYKLNVNGRDIELTEQEVLARAQKVSSADEYLQSAAEALKSATTASTPSQDEPASVQEEDVEATLTSALMGDKEAIKAVAKRLQAPPVNSTDVLKAVDDKLSFRSAVDWFKAEYADVTSDPMLYKLVVDRDAELAKTQPTLGYRDRLKSAGDTVRTWRDKIKGPATPVNPKLARKAAAPQVPQATASARQAAPADEDDVEEPVESVIDKLARARGKPGSIRPGSRQ